MAKHQPDPSPLYEGGPNKLTFTDLDNLRGDKKEEDRAARRYGIVWAAGIAATAGGITLGLYGGLTSNATELGAGISMDIVGVTSLAMSGFASIRHSSRAAALNTALVRLVDRSELDPLALRTGLQEATEFGPIADPQATMNFVILATQLDDLMAAKGIDLKALRELAPTEGIVDNTATQASQLPPPDPQSPIQ